jgi:hypothetical protein
MKVDLMRVPDKFLRIDFSDIGADPESVFISEKLVFEIAHDPYHKIKKAFPNLFRSLKKKCSSKEQIREVEQWFNQEVDAILRPLSYYV